MPAPMAPSTEPQGGPQIQQLHYNNNHNHNNPNRRPMQQVVDGMIDNPTTATTTTTTAITLPSNATTNIPTIRPAASALGISSNSHAPLFERLVSDEVQELKACVKIIEGQNRRLADLERLHADLEARLVRQSKEQVELQRNLEMRDRMWAERCKALEKEKEELKGLVQVEHTKNDKLVQQVIRKDQDIQRMVQRKWGSSKGGGGHNMPGVKQRPVGGPSQAATTTSAAAAASSRNPESSPLTTNKSPWELVNQNGLDEVVRERHTVDTLLDFFGM